MAKVIIAGCRGLTNINDVEDAWNAAMREWGSPLVTEVVSGAAPGVDQLGEILAEWKAIPVRRFPAEWARLGKRAGPTRNGQMARYADRLIAVWDGESRGTANMIETMRALGKPVYVHRFAWDDPRARAGRATP